MDFDAEDDRRKRKHLEIHREYSHAHDTEKDPALEEGAQAQAQRPMHDLDKLRGRGNGSVRIAMMEGMQKTHGNRAVQRFFGGTNPLAGLALPDPGQAGTMLGTPKDGKSKVGGIVDAVIGGIGAALGGLSPRDPMVEMMWRTQVINPIQSVVTRLKNVHGSETEKLEELKQIRSELRDARLIVREIKGMIEDAGLNAELVAHLKAAINGMVAVEAGINTHIPEKEDSSVERTMLEMYVAEAKELGDALIEESPPYNPVTKKPIDPSRPAADNPMATRLWSMSVVQPMDSAIKKLKGHPTKAKLAEALEEVSRARKAVESQMLMTLMTKRLLGFRVDKVSQYLLVVQRHLEDKLGKQVPLEDLAGELEMRSIPMEYLVNQISIASGQIAQAAQSKKDVSDGSADTK